MQAAATPVRTAPPLRAGDHLPLIAMLVGFAVMALPTLWKLSNTFWSGDSQGHGPVILSVSLWLLWRKREALLALPQRPAAFAAPAAFVLTLVMYVIGRSQEMIQLEVGALIVGIAALLLLVRGWAALRMAAFPLFFLLFLVPLPGVFVQAATVPLKTAVSYMTEVVMHALGYPVARSGVILSVGQYQLLVADACAGLTSIFTLESLGLLYLNLIGHDSALRNSLLAILIIPISFVANVVRVVILVLVTYHFGDAAGQGFIHGFAGIVLFAVATVLMVATDTVLGSILRRWEKA
jgi:exosortase B